METQAERFQRYLTFENLPSKIFVSTEKLVDAGFEYCTYGNIVICRKCNLHANICDVGEEPHKFHLEMSPDCVFVQRHGFATQEDVNSRIHNANSVLNRDISTFTNDENGHPYYSYTTLSNKPVCQPTDGEPSQPELEESISSNCNNLSVQSHNQTNTTAVKSQFEECNNDSTNINTGVNTERQSLIERNSSHVSNYENLPVQSNKTTVKSQSEEFNHDTHRQSPNASSRYNLRRYRNQNIIRSQSPISNQYINDNRNYENWNNSRTIHQYDDRIPHQLTNEDRSYSPIQTTDYTIKENRLRSYEGNWSDIHFLTPSVLADAGLFYTGPRDRVECAWCKGGLLNWEYGDSPMGEHQRHFPACPFISNKIANMLTSRPTSYHSTTNQGWQRDLEASRLGQIRRSPQSIEFVHPPRNLSIPTIPTNRTKQEKRITISTLHDMGYGPEIISQAIQNLSGRELPLDVHTVLDEIHRLQENQHEEKRRERNSYSPQRENQQQQRAEVQVRTENIDSSINSSINASLLDAEDIKKLKEENEKLKGATLCKICMDKSVNVLFQPCRHLVCCESCSKRVQNCPYCRTVIRERVVTFIP